MPERITVFDFTRRIQAQFKPQEVSLVLHQRWWKVLHSKSSEEKIEKATNNKFNNAWTIHPTDLLLLEEVEQQGLFLFQPGQIKVYKDKRFGIKEFQVEEEESQGMLRFHGKQIGIGLPRNIWMRVAFGLHGHVIMMSRDEYDDMVRVWDIPDQDMVNTRKVKSLPKV